MLVTTNVNPIAKIKVVGVGGAGGNTVNTMISEYNIQGVEFMAFNTDQQALKNSLAPVTLQLGEELTQGLGVGGVHTLGAQAAEESLDQIHEHLAGAHMVFITAGMGGGTGTGAAAVVAGVAKNMGALTIAVVTKPFSFEGKHRAEIADEGIAALRDKVDTLIVIPNQKLLDILEENISFFEAMKRVDNVLAEGVQGISSLVTGTGFINVDFADVKTIMLNAGTALMGIGKASGENRAEEAARSATTNPLLELSIEGATGVLYNITGGLNLTMQEVDKAAELIKEAVDPSANVIFGVTIDEAAGDEMSITIVATGFDENKQVYSKTKSLNFNERTVTKVGEKKPEVKDEVTSLLANDDDYSIPAKDDDPDNDLDDVPAFMRKMRN
ncbi:MAG: Cell division protein FtsZ [candidate division WS6 bacterium GW2011_GWF2_39_15]|uniref:Cell division protein FtsZ n=1 Tax=candidate division WS6 bacterium GW2011_GWF2_39_15 TaxID=1619100 RepID=A0A0G0MS90_9BACT|nr:MAG: Cell division protein FtsZ [candidate division WS6 bacterium GW2011_GWF2_39_15]